MPKFETTALKIEQRLVHDGWLREHGGSHDKFSHPDRPDALIVLPRHKTVSPGVARGIARIAGWQ